MNKFIKSGLLFILFHFLISGVVLADDAESTNEEESSESATEEQAITPKVKELPPAPTIKDIAEKQQADEEALKKLIEAPVSGPYDEYNRSTPRSSLLALAIPVSDRDFDRSKNYLDLSTLHFSL